MTTNTQPRTRLATARFLGTAMVGAYIVLNLLLAVSSPLTAHWPIYGTTAITVPPMVFAMVYGIIPIARRLL